MHNQQLQGATLPLNAANNGMPATTADTILCITLGSADRTLHAIEWTSMTLARPTPGMRSNQLNSR